jgi:DNA-binding NarL/FixJ family response regulator
MGYVIAAMSVLAVAQAVCVWRLMLVARIVPRAEERITRLAHSIDLLTNTTEACFNTLAAQLAEKPAPTPAVRRDTRQRRVIGAASRGRSVKQIAAQEGLSESEVALRLHMAGKSNERKGSHASLRT